jgi:hypothetical protein
MNGPVTLRPKAHHHTGKVQVEPVNWPQIKDDHALHPQRVGPDADDKRRLLAPGGV